MYYPRIKGLESSGCRKVPIVSEHHREKMSDSNKPNADVKAGWMFVHVAKYMFRLDLSYLRQGEKQLIILTKMQLASINNTNVMPTQAPPSNSSVV